MRHRTRIAAFAATMLVAGLGLAPAASATVGAVPSSAPATAPASAPGARQVPTAQPAIAIVTPDLLRIDKQDETNNVVVFSGMDAKSKARVNWGDGQPTESVRGQCRTATALAHPDWCSVTVVHEYDQAGQFTITAVVGRTTVSKLVTISPAPVRWSPPSGFVQPAGWSLLSGTATYFPCQTVPWYYDRSRQPANGGQIYSDVITGLEMLAAETGLVFAETADPAEAALTFRWGNVGTAAATGGGAFGRGTVTFSVDDWWPTDQWPGFGIVRQPNGVYAAGHGWLGVHEVMHALGLGHVNDRTAVMNPVGGATAFNAGDLEGLHTLYKNNPCPVG